MSDAPCFFVPKFSILAIHSQSGLVERVSDGYIKKSIDKWGLYIVIGFFQERRFSHVRD